MVRPDSVPTAWTLIPAAGSVSSLTQPQISGLAGEENAVINLYQTTDCSGASVASATVTAGAFTLSSFTVSGYGLKKFYFEMVDPAGDQSDCQDSLYSYTLVSTTSPTLAAPASPTRVSPATITVSSCVDSAYFMLSATQPAASDAGWLACTAASTTSTPLTEGANPFLIWGKNADGNVADSGTALSITYDTIAPAAVTSWAMSSPSSGTISNDTTPAITGAAAEDSAIVSLYRDAACTGTLLGTGTVASGAFSISAFTVAGDGPLSFYYQIADPVGNHTACASTGLSYTLDTTPPTGTSFAINGGATHTSFADVVISLAATETVSAPVQICMAEDTDCSTCTWGAFASTRSLTLSGTNGLKTVSVKFRDARQNTTSCTSHTITLTTIQVAPNYSAAPDWNDYVKSSDTSQACDGTETAVTACLHGGELRKVVTTEPSCAGITGTDSLGVFDWSCSMSGGVAVFRSSLKAGKGLKDLMNSTPAWRPNSVTLTRSGNLSVSPSAVWWGNSVQAAPSNSGAGTSASLSAPGTIYVVTGSRTTAGYNLDADKIGLVVLGGATLSWNNSDLSSGANCSITDGEIGTPDTRCLLSMDSQRFLWLEGNFDGGGSTQPPEVGIFSYLNSFSKFMLVHASNMLSTGVLLSNNSNFNSLVGLELANSVDYGLKLDGASSNAISNLRSFNNGKQGVLVTNFSDNNAFTGVVANSNGPSLSGIGFMISLNSSSNFVSDLTAINNGNTGIKVQSSINNVLSNIVTGNQTYGIQLLTQANSNTISQLVTANNGTGIRLATASSNKFTGNLLAGSTTQCSVSGGTNPGLVDATCVSAGNSNALLRTGTSLTSAFVGKVTSDGVNSTSSLVSGTHAYAATLDWFGFANLFRSWGMGGSAFPNSDQQGQCTSGTCQIWDWSLAAANNVIRNVSGDGASTNDPAVLVACPAQVDGTEAVTNVGSSLTFLKNAYEILGDGIGNDNGLCESGESCIYTPNFGAYQGHGTLSPCAFNDGTVIGVTLYYYPSNGL